MNQGETAPTTILLAAFFKRLADIEAVVRIIIDRSPLSVLFVLRGRPERRVRLDFSHRPMRVQVGRDARDARVVVTIDAEVMQEVLRGRLAPGVALGRRELLLRGSAGDLARLIPLFDFAPTLYAEHLADAGVPDFVRPSGRAPLREAIMTEAGLRGDPIPLTKTTRTERAVGRTVGGLAFLTGYLLGWFRRRVFTRLSLFEVVAAMSRGLAAGGGEPKTDADDAPR
ncbi:MAG: hypothetical protein KJ621_16895 [Proteobacteria bacterium]|nr:hypothetical protein [Pseudomonadota bacterium]MBU1741052.1 hypothetical protein [Pseudomonadota bacterium]